MGFIWHVPRKRTTSSEPRITIAKKFISLNPPCVEKYFKNKEYVKIGYDEKTKKLIFIPVAESDKYRMKIITNAKSSQKYINAERIFKNFSISMDKTEFKCSLDESSGGVVINLEEDKIA